MTERIFDTSRYKYLPDSIRTQALHEDLSGLVIEAGDLPLEERINPRRFKIFGSEVRDPLTKKSVIESFSEDTTLSRRESVAARSFYRYLLDNGPGALVVSISPSGGEANYLEGRVNVGLRQEEEIEFYPVPTRLTPEALYIRAMLLNEHTVAPIKFSSAEELREISIPVVVPFREDPWEFLEKVLLLDSDAWTTIRQGKPWVVKQKAGQDAEVIAKTVSAKITSAKTNLDYLYAGALAEKLMIEAGWTFGNRACPGLFNFQILQSLGATSSFFITDSFDNIRISTKKYVEKCGNCAREIRSYISSGYQCPHCKRVYRGC